MNRLERIALVALTAASVSCTPHSECPDNKEELTTVFGADPKAWMQAPDGRWKSTQNTVVVIPKEMEPGLIPDGKVGFAKDDQGRINLTIPKGGILHCDR